MTQHFSKVLFGMLLLGGITWCAPKQGGPGSDSSGTAAASIEHGKYLVKTTGCGDCHTPWTMGPNGPMQDTTKMLSGHPAGIFIPGPAPMAPPWMASIDMSFTAFSGPWGVSYAANLTPDSSGLGGWSQDQFIQAIRTGKHMGNGRPIMPPMPWPAFSNMTDNDLASIFMYLRSIPAVSNNVPAPIAGLPGMGAPPPPPAAGAPPNPVAPPSADQGRPPMPPNAPKRTK